MIKYLDEQTIGYQICRRRPYWGDLSADGDVLGDSLCCVSLPRGLHVTRRRRSEKKGYISSSRWGCERECLDHLLGRKHNAHIGHGGPYLGPQPLIGRFQPTRRLRIVLPSSTRWSFPVRRIRQTQDQMYFLQGQTCLLSKMR